MNTCLISLCCGWTLLRDETRKKCKTTLLSRFSLFRFLFDSIRRRAHSFSFMTRKIFCACMVVATKTWQSMDAKQVDFEKVRCKYIYFYLMHTGWVHYLALVHALSTCIYVYSRVFLWKSTAEFPPTHTHTHTHTRARTLLSLGCYSSLWTCQGCARAAQTALCCPISPPWTTACQLWSIQSKSSWLERNDSLWERFVQRNALSCLWYCSIAHSSSGIKHHSFSFISLLASRTPFWTIILTPTLSTWTLSGFAPVRSDLNPQVHL